MSNTRLPAWNLKQLMDNYKEDYVLSTSVSKNEELSEKYRNDFILLFFEIISKRRLTPIEEVVAVTFFPEAEVLYTFLED